MIGRRLGSYEITAKLGEGGMGEVYRATDSRLKRDVAIKVLPPAFTADPERLARFEREAQLLAQLQHPHIASIYGLEEADGVRALVMELVNGPTLAERIAEGAMAPAEALPIARQIAEALEAAHERGIIHRDLKPQNVKLTADGTVKVLDFGLAKAMDPGSGAGGSPTASPALMNSPTLTAAGTQLGVILGTAAYMAPEQAKGFAVDKRVDIWAFGVVLFEMLTGKRLFAGDSVPDTLAGVLRAEIDLGALPAETPAALRRLLRRCLERNAKNRLHDIADARLVIDDLIAGRGEAPVPGAVAPVPPPMRGRWIVALGALALAVAAGYFAGQAGTVSGGKTPTPSTPRDFRKLTFLPGQEGFPALSPDGKSLFFSARREGGVDLDIFFLPVGGRRPIDLTADSVLNDVYPAVSPDGTTVAFRSDRSGGGIYLMGTTGESPRRLVDGCFDPAWSPDGARIVCTTIPADDPFDRGGSGQLKIVELATGVSRSLATGDAAAPTWSPDGRWIAYWGLQGNESGRRDLWNIAAAGGDPIPLTDDAPYDWNPVWSADGSRLFFLSNRGGGPNLWRLAIDRTTGKPAGAPESVVLPTEFADSIARGGDRWVFGSRAMRASVDVVDVDPARWSAVGAARRLFATTTRLQSLVLSPDGRTIAYTAVFPRQDLFVAPLDGGAPVQLTDDAANDRFASWDPDGSRILFMSNRGGRYEQWAIRPDGSGLEQLTRTASMESQWAPGLSPDRRHLSTVSENGTYLYDASGPPPWEASERLPRPAGDEGWVFTGYIWSPGGDRLAGDLESSFEDRHGRIAVWDMAKKKLQLFDPTGTVAAWTPDGRALLIDAGGQFSVLDLATRQVRELPSFAGLGRRISLTRDLRRLVSFANETESDLWLAEGIE